MAKIRRRIVEFVIRAHVPGRISLPHAGVALDALLAAQVALRDGREWGDERGPIEIPVEREPDGRFHLCTDSIGKLVEFGTQYTNRRAPIEQYQTIGPQSGRVQITAGADKSYRIPLEVGHVDSGALTWYAIGDADATRSLLSGVFFVGKKRGVGLGKVARWEVDPCNSWPGFPVVREGKALRPLPIDWPGLIEPNTGYSNLSFPRWIHSTEHLCAIPG